MALHEMPIMVPIAFVLEFFVVERMAKALAFRFVQPTDRAYFGRSGVATAGGMALGSWEQLYTRVRPWR